MDDDLKAVGTLASVFEIAATNGERLDGWTPRELLFYAKSLRTILSALRQLESLRAERDLYRLVAVNQGWNWRLCDAYGRDEYQKQREKHVDDCVAVAQSHAARAILTGSETNAR